MALTILNSHGLVRPAPGQRSRVHDNCAHSPRSAAHKGSPAASVETRTAKHAKKTRRWQARNAAMRLRATAEEVDTRSATSAGVNTISALIGELKLNQLVPTHEMGKKREVDGNELTEFFKENFPDPISMYQTLEFNYKGFMYAYSVSGLKVDGQGDDDDVQADKGALGPESTILFEAAAKSGIDVQNQTCSAATSRLFKSGSEVNFEQLGIGGLDRQFEEIFRRAFASRVYPANVVQKLGMKHVKGMLLHGPPGTGKTLIARQLGKLLNGKEPKVVNGPEVLNMYVGESEHNIRLLFEDAENEQKTMGDDSDLHVIIFDEIDAICKKRGTDPSVAGSVGDTVVNQLLTKMDGVNALNNILVIGMTNRKDMLDESILRPGRFEVHVEIALADLAGRRQILNIHTAEMKSNSKMSDCVDLERIAGRTQNYSGAEIEGLVKSAASFALMRQVNVNDLAKALDEDAIKVTMEDFDQAFQEVQPSFGASLEMLDRCRMNGIITFSERMKQLLKTSAALVEQVQTCSRTPMMTMLLDGSSGTGKTALAAELAAESGFPYVKFVTADTMVGMSEANKVDAILKVFEDANKSDMSVVVLDDIEQLIEYVDIGSSTLFSNKVLQALMSRIKRPPPKGKRILVIGTTSQGGILEKVGLHNAFNVVLKVPALTPEETKEVLTHTGALATQDVDAGVLAMTATNDLVPIKQLFTLRDIASHRAGSDGESQAPADGAVPDAVPIDVFIKCIKELKH